MASPSTKISARNFTLATRLLTGGTDVSLTVTKLSTDEFTTTSGVLKVGTGVKSEWCPFTAATVSSMSIVFTIIRGLKPNAHH